MRSFTDPVLFENLHQNLEAESKITPLLDGKPGDVIEEAVSVELSVKDQLVQLMEGVAPLAEKFTPGAQLEQFKSAMTIFRNLAPGNITVIMRPGPTQAAIVADLYPDRLRTVVAELQDDFTALCRVQKVLKDGETIDMFRIIPGMKTQEEWISGLTNISHPALNWSFPKEKFVVKYPAVKATAIAIYR